MLGSEEEQTLSITSYNYDVDVRLPILLSTVVLSRFFLHLCHSTGIDLLFLRCLSRTPR